ncbi:uncharacterized protein C8orf88 homolog isoform X1 [Protopterus annectens]|uniref:uncharacterized protein C8orf88 homolog isoform X1 n=1 Tax=Protopterus annectens TaxID=7888 RepID=UPI001CFA0B9C|nr:uncharacterized protein C8orf88 homolog isoform X1 [Protopterus annectens]
MIEAKKLIGKSLQPARPLRRSLLHCESKIWEDCQKDFSQNEMYWQDHDSLWCRVNGIQNEHVTVANKEKRITKTTEERIKYSAEFLKKCSSHPFCNEKPKFLPNHPVVLEKSKYILHGSDVSTQDYCLPALNSTTLYCCIIYLNVQMFILHYFFFVLISTV